MKRRREGRRDTERHRKRGRECKSKRAFTDVPDPAKLAVPFVGGH